jgi:tetratricopeptide (TPR) repeat protein
MAPRSALRLALAAPLVLALGCAAVGSGRTTRVSDLAQQGDARFRASQRLVIEGLDADASGDSARALGRYERALQIDSSNPWAYLALARHQLDAGDSRSALSHLDRAEALFESLDLDSPGAALHRDGLRGAALALEGRHAESQPLLDSAARRAPDVWGDGRLSASELR